MKKRLLFIMTAVLLVLSLSPASAVLAAPVITFVPPAGGFTGGTASTISISAASAGSTITSAEFQTFFGDATAPMTALEIFAQTPITPVPAPRSTGTVTTDATAAPAGVPATAIASIDILGTVTAVNTATGEWRIGNPPVFVYESVATAIQGVPAAGSSVRVMAVRTLTAGPIVAQTISQLATGTAPATVPNKAMSFLFNGTVQSITPPAQSPGIKIGGTNWDIGGNTFQVDDANYPAAIGPGITTNSSVTVKFRAPLVVNAAGSLVAQEVGTQTVLLRTALHPTPVANTLPSPANLPAGTFRDFLIDGVVTAANANGEWQIGTNSPAILVYEHAATNFVGTRRPVAGDEVFVVAKRSLASGPIVADVITLVTAGPLTAGPVTMSSTFLFNGAVQATGVNAWTVGGAAFVVNDPVVPAEIEPGITVGSGVTVEFRFVGPPVPDNGIWSSLTAGAGGTFTGTLTPPQVTGNRNGFLYVRATDAAQQVTTMAVATTLAPGTTAPPPPVAGGGGGGGGGAPPTTTVATGLTVSIGGTSSSFNVKSDGRLESEARGKSADGKVNLTIPANTLCNDRDGQRLTTIEMKDAKDVPPPPAGNQTVGIPQEFGPDGATFDPPIKLSFAIDVSLIPAGVAEKDLTMAFFNGATGKWVSVPTTVDTVNHTVTGDISHFTTFAVLAPVTAAVPPTATTPAPATTPTQPPASTTPAAQAGQPSLTITAPASGATLPEGNVTVSVTVKDFTLVAPGGANEAGKGHIHYYLDTTIPTAPGAPATTAPGTYKPGAGTSMVWENLKAGTHTFGVQLVNANHTPLTPPVLATVTVTVSTSAPATTTPSGSQTPAGTNWGLIIGIIVAVIVVAVLLVVLLRRKPAKP